MNIRGLPRDTARALELLARHADPQATEAPKIKGNRTKYISKVKKNSYTAQILYAAEVI